MTLENSLGERGMVEFRRLRTGPAGSRHHDGERDDRSGELECNAAHEAS
jgi:hypothetical protein